MILLENVKIFADGANKSKMLELYKNPLIGGFTTNPSLLTAAGITNFKEFVTDIVSEIPDRSISFEVFADDFDEMVEQGKEISSWGENVFVKIPITNTKGESTYHVIKKLSSLKIKLNITAITTIKQVEKILPALNKNLESYISVFAGRIADTGVNPLPIMEQTLKLIEGSDLKLIWASSRELYNIIQADEIGCQIITVPHNILNKLPLLGKDLTEYSLETVKKFAEDSKNFSL
jgi:transaldolase